MAFDPHQLHCPTCSNRLVDPIKLHQQEHVVNQRKHARTVTQQGYRAFARSYLQPGKIERNTSKEGAYFPGVMSGRLGPPSWLMRVFFLSLSLSFNRGVTMELCAVDTRVFLCPQTWARLHSTAQRQRHTLGNAPPLDAPPEPPAGVGANAWERKEWNSSPQIFTWELKNALKNERTGRIPKMLNLRVWFVYFIFVSARGNTHSKGLTGVQHF